MSPSDETDLQRIPFGGTPGYTIYTLRRGYRFSEAFRASLALENITDKDYRTHGSGQNEAGTSAVGDRNFGSCGVRGVTAPAARKRAPLSTSVPT